MKEQNGLNKNECLILMNNISSFIKERRANLLLVVIPTVDKLQKHTELEMLSQAMCIDRVYKSFSQQTLPMELYFEKFNKKIFKQIIKNNFDLYKNCFIDYSDEYLEDICSCDPEVIQGDGYFMFEDYQSNAMNIKDGVRETIGNLEDNVHNVFLFGNSTTFGYYVKDGETIASYLQQLLKEYKYNVHNCATNNDVLLNIYNRVTKTGICDNDIVIIGIPQELLGENVRLFPHIDVTSQFEIHNEYENFIDRAHLTSYCHNWIAKEICKAIHKDIVGFTIKENNVEEKVRVLINDFQCVTHFSAFDSDLQIGASVMSCNPFTAGHRHLVEVGSKLFDYFVIFLMQEGMNLVFNKTECEKLVNIGVEDLENVIVVPMSDVFSYQTYWSEYNDVALRHSKNIVGLNTYELLNIVGKTFNAINIKHFLCGIETNDVITNQHIVQAKTVFSKNDINVITIPRKKMANNMLSISGTQCRNYLKLKQYDTLKGFLQPQVLEYIQQNNLEVQEPKFNTKYTVDKMQKTIHDNSQYKKDKMKLVVVDKNENTVEIIKDLRELMRNLDNEAVLKQIIGYQNAVSVWAGYYLIMQTQEKTDFIKDICNEVFKRLKDEKFKQDVIKKRNELFK